MEGDLHPARVRWACRRGMLELDLLLLRFYDQRYAGLSRAQQIDFEALLTSADPDLFQWCMGHTICPEPAFQALIHAIRATPVR